MAPLSRGLALLESAVSHALAVAPVSTPQLLRRPTPCPGWDLETLLGHVSDSIGVLHEAIATGGGGTSDAPPGYPGPGPDPVARLRSQAAGLLAACAAAGPDRRRVAVGDRELTASMVAVTRAIEIAVHGWDVSAACTPGRAGAPQRLKRAPAQAGPRRFPGIWLVYISRPPGKRRGTPQEHGRTGGTDMSTTIAGKAVLVTGANRGIGRALVAEALTRGANRVYAGTRQPLAHPAGRVTPLTLDVTSPAQIQAAAAQVGSLDVLINNAGIALYDDLSDRAVLEQHLAVNLLGTWGVTQAFLPHLTRSRGAIVNNVSMMALAPFPITPAYAISKAAAFNLTQSLRALLAGRGVNVHAVLTGPTDTDMTRGFDIPKAAPQAVARAIFDGVEHEEEDIFPDPASQPLAESWRSGMVKELERQYAPFAAAALARVA